MANQILIKKGVEGNRLGITPAGGELIWTTDDHQLYIGDGSTPGGISVTAKAASLYVPLTQKAQADGVATLGPDGKIPSNQLPPIEIGHVFVVATEAEMHALTGVSTGDVCVVNDTVTPANSANYVASSTSTPSTDPIPPADWVKLASAVAPVDTVNGQTGNVLLTTNEVAEGTNNLYYTDARGQVSANTKIQNTINDTSGLGGTDLLWSANKIQSELNALGGAQLTTLESLTDTDTSNANSGDCMKMTNGKWTAQAPDIISFSLGELDNVDAGADNAVDGSVIIKTATGYVSTVLSGENLVVTNYSIAANATAIQTTDTINTALGKLEKGIEDAQAGGEVNVQSDWNETDTNADSFIVNKPDCSLTRIGDMSNVPEFATDDADALKVLRVDGAGQSVEFVDASAVGRTTLESLNDTSVVTPSDGQVLTWNVGTSKWVNTTSPAGVTLLSQLQDTAITSPAISDYLTWDGSNWANGTLPTMVTTLTALTDTTITNPQANEFLRWTGTTWENAVLPTQVTTFQALTDTPSTYGTAGQMLQINSATNGLEYTSTIDGGGF